jgi:vesicle-fusing ATPase
VAGADVALAGISIGLDLIVKKSGAPKLSLDCDELTEEFKKVYVGQVFSARQELAMDFNGMKLALVVDNLDHAVVGLDDASDSRSKSLTHGQILQMTNLTWNKSSGSVSNISFTGGSSVNQRNDSLFKKDFDFEKMGIGGLGTQFQTMFRRAFASRMFPGLVKQLGINHVRGILLYGPPGCGKTLIARQIGKVLNAREPKIINGPEVLDKFVGGSEEKIRALFADAEKEQAESGDSSMLHIIIFDEMDAVMKTRGSSTGNTGVSDSIVNQLLSKIDGVDSLNNILIIGMTNRKDMIDDAILRPGRLELHIEITLPNEEGRVQILNIHTASMKTNKRIAQSAIDQLPALAAMTKNFTGAEIEGLVRNAASYALARNIDLSSVKTVDEAALAVEWRDFERAFSESVPAFGNKDNDEINSYFRNGICNYGPAFESFWGVLQRLMMQIKTSARTPLMSILLEGGVSTGKTAVAAKLCSESDFPFIRMISADAMIGHSESQKCATLLRIFSDSYKSPLSIIFIDDIERIIDYSPIGPRFSNTVLQTLLVLIRKMPPVSSRLMIIATTSISHYMDDLQLTAAFNVTVHVSQLQGPSEIGAVLTDYILGDASKNQDSQQQQCSMTPMEIKNIAKAVTKPIGIKQLLMVLEMARSDVEVDADDDRAGPPGSISPEQFLECLHTAGF